MDNEQEVLTHNGKQYKKIASDDCEKCAFYEQISDYRERCNRPLGDFEGCATGFVFVEVKS